MTNLCLEAGLPKPEFEYDSTGLWVTFRKDIYTSDQLEKIGLTSRQVKAVLFAKENGEITNSDYQKITSVSKRTATSDLTELVEKHKVLKKIGTSGAGIYYQIIG